MFVTKSLVSLSNHTIENHIMIDINDFHAVYDKVRPLSAHWKQIAISLRLRIDTINSIEANCRGEDISHYIYKVLEYWLKKDYDYKTNGIPCWRRVCVAVKEGGGDPALADEIAREHPLPAMPPAGSTNSKGIPHAYHLVLSCVPTCMY